MGNLIDEYFEIETAKESFETRYISPIWAKGFDCNPRSCGLCCMVYMPETVPKQIFRPFNERICGYFNPKQRLCGEYAQRRWGCKTYPFMFGVEDGQLIVSPTLECPATNLSQINLESVRKTFRDPLVSFVLDYQNEIYQRVKQSKAWYSAEDFWALLENELTTFLDSNAQFPLLNEVAELIYDCADHFLQIKTKHPQFPPIFTLISSIAKDKGGIMTTFESSESTKVYHVNIKNFQVHVKTWNPKAEKINIFETRLSPQPQELEIKRDGKQILRDYISLLFRRPFLSLSTISFAVLPRSIPLLLAGNFVGNFVHLEAGANLFAFKFSETGLNKKGMRELISFADGRLLSQFRNPVQSIHP